MKRKAFATILLLCCFAFCMAAVIADMNGKFSGTLNAPDGNQYQLAYTFKVDSGKLTGTLETNGISVPLDSGKVSGNDMAFSVTVENVSYPHKCKYYPEGDSVAVDVNFAGTKAHTTLQRAK